MDRATWRNWYSNTYLKSEHWREYRSGEYQRAGYRCEVCGANNIKLICHHEDYYHMWNEIPGVSTTVVCETCHSWCHSKYKTFEQQQRWCESFRPQP